MQSLEKGRKQEGVVIYQTDKSGRFSIDIVHNYRKACQPHAENDPTVSQEYHETKNPKRSECTFNHVVMDFECWERG